MTRQHQKSRSVSQSPLWIALVIIAACDHHEEDFIPNASLIGSSKSEYYILRGTSVVIDVNAIVKKSFKTNFAISKNPDHGELIRLDASTLRYIPSAHFVTGSDKFALSVTRNNSLVKIDTVVVTIKENTDQFLCGFFAVEDRAVTTINTPVFIDMLDNDRVCGVQRLAAKLSIYSKPRHAQATIAGESIQYIPDPEFFGLDSLVYTISISEGDDYGAQESYGFVSIRTTPE